MKKEFTSRGYTYRLCDSIEFGDKYFSDAGGVTEEYLNDCLRAEGVSYVKDAEEFLFFIPPQSTEEDIFNCVLEHYENDFPKESYLTAYYAMMTITDNLWELSTRKYKTNLV